MVAPVVSALRRLVSVDGSIGYQEAALAVKISASFLRSKCGCPNDYKCMSALVFSILEGETFICRKSGVPLGLHLP
jgi:hypothetical protein